MNIDFVKDEETGAGEAVAGIGMVGILKVVIEVNDNVFKVHCSNLGVSALRNAINSYINRMEDSYENSNSGR